MGKLHIIMYHYIRDLKHSRYPRIKGMDVRLFRRQIEFLKSRFTIVTMEQVIEAAQNRGRLPEHSLLLTFDDGYADNYIYVLPILEEANVQGSFFISGKTFVTHQLLDVNKVHYILASGSVPDLLSDLYSKMNYYRGQEYDFPSNQEMFQNYGKESRFDSADVIFIKRMLQTALPEKLRNKISSEMFETYVGIPEEQLSYELYMTEDQIRAMKRHGMFIGIHGWDHYWLGDLPKGKMQQDIDQALGVMGEFVDEECWVMNYPYGSVNEDVVEYVRQKGAKLGLTVRAAVADLEEDNIYLLPRFDCNDFPPKSKNYIAIF